MFFSFEYRTIPEFWDSISPTSNELIFPQFVQIFEKTLASGFKQTELERIFLAIATGGEEITKGMFEFWYRRDRLSTQRQSKQHSASDKAHPASGSLSNSTFTFKNNVTVLACPNVSVAPFSPLDFSVYASRF